MASPSVPVGGVTEGPPPAGVDPLIRATTPVAGQTHDIVLGGVGFTLYRGNEDTLPSKVYTSEAVDYTYSPTFIDRSNTSGDWGDDMQDFFMSSVQKDWSAGEGRKYFRKQGGADGYWAGENLQPTIVPGQVRAVGGIHAVTALTQVWQNGLYVKGSGSVAAAQDPGDSIARVSGDAATTVKMEYSTDGGATWTTQLKTGATIWNDCVDMCMGDDGLIYCLEGSKTTTQSMIHTFKGPSLTTVAWTNWTAHALQSNTMCYFQGGIYVGDSAGKLCSVVSAGTKTTIKDFAGGIIIQLLSTPEGIYILYLSAAGNYKVFVYAGGNVTEVLNLPRGWRTNYILEAGVWPDRTAFTMFAHGTDAMCWSEGVLYITGLSQARDQQQSRLGEAKYRSALYYYNAGNSGFIWEAEESRYHEAWGGACVGPISDGMIAWIDGQNDRVMVYDPRTGGVFCLMSGGVFTDQSPISTANPTITTAIANNTSTVIALTGNTIAFLPGTIVRDFASGGPNTDERMMCTGDGQFASALGTLKVVRGWNGTTALTATTSTTGDTLIPSAYTPFPVTRLIFDFTNYTLTKLSSRTVTTSGPMIAVGGFGWYLNLRESDIGALAAQSNPSDSLLATAPRHSWLQSSAFDFESSLSKYFRSIQVDFDTLSFPLRTDEAAGLVHAWYKLDGIMSRPFDPYFRPTDLVPVNSTTTTVVTGTANTSITAQNILVSAGHGAVVGAIVYGNGGISDESAIVTAVNGNTLTLQGGRQYMGRTAFAAAFGSAFSFPIRSATAFATGAVITIQNPITSGTRYNVNATGKQIQIMVDLVGGATSASTPISLGPIIRKMVVRGAPIQPGFREREYQIAMFNDQPRMSQSVTGRQNVPKETRTPAELRTALDTLVRAGTPIAVSDGSMTNVTCVIEPDKSKIRELRAGEYVAFVFVREI